MKSTPIFRDQVSALSQLWDRWNECEQTVALYTLVHRLAPVQARFLSRVLEHQLQHCTELGIREQRANSPAYLETLSREPREVALSQLLLHLPLLSPGNTDAKLQYLELVPLVLSHSIHTGCQLEESRHLLSYLLIHPALSIDDRRKLTLWLQHLEDVSHSTNQTDVVTAITSAPTPPPATSTSSSCTSTTVMAPSLTNDYSTHQFLNGGVGDASNTVSSSVPSSSKAAPTTVGNGNCSSSVSSATPKSASITTSVSSSPSPTSSSSGSVWSNGYQRHNGQCGGVTGLGHHHQHVPLHVTSSLPPVNRVYGTSSAPNPISNGGGPALQQSNLRRSNSITPPGCCNSNSSIGDCDSMSMICNNATPLCQKRRSMSLSFENSPLSPQSSLTSSGSGSESFINDESGNLIVDLESSGMKDVPSWLKSLRLHKYASLFAQLSYDDMMSLTEEKLEAQGVTKGARHKIVLSVQKLKERQSWLKALEKDVVEGGNLRNALMEVKALLMTPLKAQDESMGNGDNQHSSSDSVNEVLQKEVRDENNDTSNLTFSSPDVDSSHISVTDGDLPGQFTKLLGKICTQLLVSTQPEDENCALFIHILDKCLAHEAFNATLKKRLLSWRQQIQKAWHPLPPRKGSDSRHTRNRWFTHHNGGSFIQEPGLGSTSCHLNTRRRTISTCPTSSSGFGILTNGNPQQSQIHTPQQQRCISLKLHEDLLQGVVGSGCGGVVEHISLNPLCHPVTTAIFNKRPSLQEPAKPHATLQRTKSAPVHPNRVFSHYIRPTNEPILFDPEINTCLESLCLSVTEHALGGLDGPIHWSNN